MHRMHRLFVTSGLVLAGLIVAAPRASASLIRASVPPLYPDLHADVNGTIHYDYDPDTDMGVFDGSGALPDRAAPAGGHTNR